MIIEIVNLLEQNIIMLKNLFLASWDIWFYKLTEYNDFFNDFFKIFFETCYECSLSCFFHWSCIDHFPAWKMCSFTKLSKSWFFVSITITQLWNLKCAYQSGIFTRNLIHIYNTYIYIIYIIHILAKVTKQTFFFLQEYISSIKIASLTYNQLIVLSWKFVYMCLRDW